MFSVWLMYYGIAHIADTCRGSRLRNFLRFDQSLNRRFLLSAIVIVCSIALIFHGVSGIIVQF